MNDSEYQRDKSFGIFMEEVKAATFFEEPELLLYSQVDNPPQRPNDRRMTDINRQQVADMLAASEAKVDARLANFDTSVKTGFSDLRAEFADLRAELAKQAADTRVEMANVRADAQKGATEITRWVVGFGIAILGAVFTLSKVGDKPSTPPAAQAAPIIITVPGAAPVTAAPAASVPARK